MTVVMELAALPKPVGSAEPEESAVPVFEGQRQRRSRRRHYHHEEELEEADPKPINWRLSWRVSAIAAGLLLLATIAAPATFWWHFQQTFVNTPVNATLVDISREGTDFCQATYGVGIHLTETYSYQYRGSNYTYVAVVCVDQYSPDIDNQVVNAPLGQAANVSAQQNQNLTLVEATINVVLEQTPLGSTKQLYVAPAIPNQAYEQRGTETGINSLYFFYALLTTFGSFLAVPSGVILLGYTLYYQC